MNWLEAVFERLNLYQPKGGGVSRYLIMLVLMGTALLVRIAVAPLDAGLQYLTFFPAVALSAILGGFWPGLSAVFIGMCMATFIFVPPYYTISLHSLQVAFWANMVFMIDGLVVCSAVVAMRRYQEKLNASIDELKHTEQIIRTTQEGFWFCDTQGRVLEVNDSYCRMVGYSREALLTMRIDDLEADHSSEAFARHIQQIMEVGHDTFETRHRRKDGIFVNLEISVNRSSTRDDAFIVFARDITERVGREARRLAEVKEQRDVLVREVHHRIKNHLQGVVGLLRQSAIDHPDLVDVINAAIGKIRSIAIIHGLQASMLSEEVNLGDLMASIIDATCSQIEYENNLEQPVFLNREEAVPIALVLNELLTNACKYRSENCPATVRFGTNGDNTIIRIANHTEEDRQEAMSGGQGLNLVKSLLPRQSADLEIGLAGNIFTAELILSPPVTILKAGQVE